MSTIRRPIAVSLRDALTRMFEQINEAAERGDSAAPPPAPSSVEAQVQRLLAAVAGVPRLRLQRGKLEAADWQRLMEAAATIASVDLSLVQVCDACGGVMGQLEGCALEHLVIEGARHRRLPLGAETLWEGGSPQRCGDCGASLGTYHHPGCQYEQCPRCGNQLIACDCEKADVP